MKELKNFNYVDAKDKHTSRVVYPIYEPSDKLFAIDLSEFTPEEREFYKEQLDNIHAVYLEEIRQLGLGSNYRYFKEDRITYDQ